MLFQITNEILVFQIISGILILFSILATSFSSVALVRMFERKKIAILYYALSNLTFLFTMSISNIGLIDLIQTGEKTQLYLTSLLGMNIGIIITSMFLFLFYEEIIHSQNKKKKRNWVIIICLLIIGFQLLPFNNWFDPHSEGFQIKYISYLFQTIYCVGIYLISAIGFFKNAKQIQERRKNFLFIAWGDIFFAIFFVLMLSRAFLSGLPIFPYFQISSWIILTTGLIFLFIGYILPTFEQVEEN